MAAVISPWNCPDGDYLTAAGGEAHARPGASIETLLAQAGAADVERIVVSMDEGAAIPALAEPYFITQAIRAANDWLIDQWLTDQDERLYGLMLVPTHDPELAVREIARVGDNPRIVGVHLCGNGLGKPFGHPVYHPIYAAASARALPVAIETGGDVFTDTLTHPAAGGLPMTFGELAALQGCTSMTHIVSMVSQGVFGLYPELRLMLMGCGITCIPWLFWRSDTEWRAARREIPWAEASPSDYFRSRVRFMTTPLGRAGGRFDVFKALSAVGGSEDVCCFGSNYPRWNTESADEIRDVFPPEWQRKILYENAMQFLRWV